MQSSENNCQAVVRTLSLIVQPMRLKNILVLLLLLHFYEAKYFHASNEVKLEICFCATIAYTHSKVHSYLKQCFAYLIFGFGNFFISFSLRNFVKEDLACQLPSS